MKITTAHIKSIILGIACFVVMWLAFNSINTVIQTSNYISPNSDVLVLVGLLILIGLYITSINIGASTGIIKYIMGPLPVVASGALVFAKLQLESILIFSGLAYLILISGIYNASKFKDLLVKFESKLILRQPIRSVILIVALYSGVAAYNHVSIPQNMDTIIMRIENFVGNIYDQAAGQIIDQQTKELGSTFGMGSIDSETAASLKDQYGISVDEANLQVQQTLDNTKSEIKSQAMKKITDMIDQYKAIIPFILALLIFGVIQFVGEVVYVLYYLTINSIFKLAKAAGFIKLEYVDIKKEIISF